LWVLKGRRQRRQPETNLDFLKLRRVPPLLSPVSSTHSLSGSSTNGLKHELGGVGVGRAGRSVPLQVLFPDVSEVDALSPSLEEEESVEILEEKGVGLMDGAEDRLAGGGELSKESDDIEGGLSVETRGGLVKEEEKLRLRSKLNSNAMEKEGRRSNAVEADRRKEPGKTTHVNRFRASTESP
jgi:hypothetical protein